MLQKMEPEMLNRRLLMLQSVFLLILVLHQVVMLILLVSEYQKQGLEYMFLMILLMSM